MKKLGLNSNLVCVKYFYIELWFFLVFKVKSSEILIFKVSFPCQTWGESFRLLFSKRAQILVLTYFITLFSLNVSDFWPSKPKRTKLQLRPCIFSKSQPFIWGHANNVLFKSWIFWQWIIKWCIQIHEYILSLLP